MKILPNLLCHPSHTVNELTPKTGEVATMDKPFQCEHCDKCFSEYLTLSAHNDHYHGFSRRFALTFPDAGRRSILG